MEEVILHNNIVAYLEVIYEDGKSDLLKRRLRPVLVLYVPHNFHARSNAYAIGYGVQGEVLKLNKST